MTRYLYLRAHRQLMSDGRQQQQQQQQLPTSNVNTSNHGTPDAQPSSAVEMHSVKPTVIVVQPDEEVTFSLQLISKSDKASARMLEIATSQSLLRLWPHAYTYCAASPHVIYMRGKDVLQWLRSPPCQAGIIASKSWDSESSISLQVCCGVEEDAKDGSGAQQQTGDGQGSQRKPHD